MPPVPAQRRALSQEDPALSDEDVGFLFQIITRAERDPEADRLPYRVLFKEYDQAIAEHGVDSDPGYACMRFLFKMGSKDVVGETLFDKFENLLQQMGIVIEFGIDDHDGEHYTDNVSSVDVQYRTKYDPHSRDASMPTPRRRRASFNSMYDIGDDLTQRSFINRPSSRSSMSRLQIGKPEFRESLPHRSSIAKQAESPERTDRTQLIAQFLDVGRRLMSRMDLLESTNKRSREPTSAVHHDRSKRMAQAMQAKASKPRSLRSTSSGGSEEDEQLDEGESDEASFSSQDGSNSIGKLQVPPEMLYRPSLSDLLRDASTFNMYRQRAINRRIITQWMKKAVQTRQTHQNMEIVAVNRDRITLVRQAFEMWHATIRSKRQVEQTERFFKHLEERAGRARDLYLMTKAFTHWAQLTSDEVERTSAARRHILSVKYFNAWREITAVNELKAQRFALRRPLLAWRQRGDQMKKMGAQAVAHHDQRVTHKFYWQWFWSFCDRRAPQWYDYCLKRRALLYWLRTFRTNRERILEIDIQNRQLSLGSSLQALSQRYKAISSADVRATSIQRRKVLNESFAEWRVKTQLAPAASRVSNMLDSNIVQEAFMQWVKRARMLKQAREIDQRRVVRNAWVAWNDRLRCQALSARIEERLKMETMYKWILTERYRLMQRIREQRIKREVFFKFVTNVRETYSQLLYHADMHEDHRNEELLKSKFACWRDRLTLQRQRDVVAFEFYAPRLVQESLIAWRSKTQHITKLEDWARDARFYFVASGSIKLWHLATLKSAKHRRQEAYAKTRRRIKINLASRALVNWHSKTHEIQEMEQRAIQFCRTKSLTTTSELINRWQEKTTKRTQECEEADTYYFQQLAYDQLIRWAEAVVEYRQLQEQANGVYRLHVLSQANAQLRKLSLRVFQVNSTVETADAMRERNLRKHTRGMFRHWVDKTRMNLEARDSPGPLISPTKNYDGAADPRTDQSVFDPWYQAETPFKVNEFAPESQVPSATPLTTPNYLTSPSKRAARARALARASTTPATPLHTPFASRLLRAETMAVQTTSSRRDRSGRGSALGASVRFVDEEPESPTDGRRSANRRIA